MSLLQPLKHEIRTTAPAWFEPSTFMCPECNHANTIQIGNTVSYYPRNYRETLDVKIDHSMYKCLCAKANNRKRRIAILTPRSSCYTCSRCSSMESRYVVCEDLRCTKSHKLNEIACECPTTYCKCELSRECPCEWCNCKCENTPIIHTEIPRHFYLPGGFSNKAEAKKTNGQKIRKTEQPQ